MSTLTGENGLSPSVSVATDRDPTRNASAIHPLAVDRSQVAIALIVTLLISRLPEIILRDIAGLEFPALAWPIAALAITAAIWLGARSIAWLRPVA